MEADTLRYTRNPLTTAIWDCHERCDGKRAASTGIFKTRHPV